MLDEGADLGRLQNAALWCAARNYAEQDDSLEQEELHWHEAGVLEYTFRIVREQGEGVLAQGNDEESCEHSRLLNHNETGLWSESAHVHHFEGASNIYFLLFWHLEIHIAHKRYEGQID